MAVLEDMSKISFTTKINAEGIRDWNKNLAVESK